MYASENWPFYFIFCFLVAETRFLVDVITEVYFVHVPLQTTLSLFVVLAVQSKWELCIFFVSILMAIAYIIGYTMMS